MKPAILKDPAKQAQFDRDGYLVIDFLKPEDVAIIADKFYEVHPDLPPGFFSAAFNPDDEVKRDIFEHTDKIFDKVVNEQFKDFKKLGSTFLCKAPGESGVVEVHQDWTVVDESKYYSVTLWVPTVDTNEENGALRVLPGSHLFFDTYRSNHIPISYRGSEKLIWDNMITVPMKAGQAFLINHAVIHASAPNKTDKERLVIAYGLIPEDAKLLYYHKNEKGKVEKFDMPDDFFQRYYNVGQRPLFGTVVEEFDYIVKEESPLRVSYLINKEQQSRNKMPIFKNPETQKFFDENGYVKLPALSEAEVSELMAFHESVRFKDEAGFGFHISMDQQDKGLVKNILDKLLEVGFPKIQQHLLDAKAFVGSFVIKEPNPTSVVPVHQDWSFVEDEEKHCSITCWIPLVDVNIDNGALGVIKGSHQYFKNFRPSPSPQVPSPISEHMFSIFPYLQLIEMKAGEVLFFDNRTFHGSPPNTTDKPRIAFGIGITNADAKLIHYNLKPDGKNDTVFKYYIDQDFFLKYENSRLSKMFDKKELIEGYKVEEELPFILPKFTSDELITLIKSTGNEFNVPMCEKLAKLFSNRMDESPKEKEPAAPEVQEAPAPAPEPVVEKKWVWVDDRTFLQKYTPLNILKEVKRRVFAD
jgi:ectoine hydroxylase-related dioxygenase (phytanoyl-CoA dioxygenase family)